MKIDTSIELGGELLKIALVKTDSIAVMKDGTKRPIYVDSANCEDFADEYIVGDDGNWVDAFGESFSIIRVENDHLGFVCDGKCEPHAVDQELLGYTVEGRTFKRLSAAIEYAAAYHE